MMPTCHAIILPLLIRQLRRCRHYATYSAIFHVIYAADAAIVYVIDCRYAAGHYYAYARRDDLRAVEHVARKIWRGEGAARDTAELRAIWRGYSARA